MTETKLALKGIFFDLDGTIVDSREAYAEAARTAFATIGQGNVDVKAALEIPRRMEQNLPLQSFVRGDLKEFVETYLRVYYSITKTKTKPFPNVKATLDRLNRKVKLALITMRLFGKKQSLRSLSSLVWHGTSRM